MRGPDLFGDGDGGGGCKLHCTTCFVPLTPLLAFAIDPDGFVVPYVQAVEMYAELPPPIAPLDPADPRDWSAIAQREALPICRGCAKGIVNE